MSRMKEKREKWDKTLFIFKFIICTLSNDKVVLKGEVFLFDIILIGLKTAGNL